MIWYDMMWHFHDFILFVSMIQEFSRVAHSPFRLKTFFCFLFCFVFCRDHQRPRPREHPETTATSTTMTTTTCSVPASRFPKRELRLRRGKGRRRRAKRRGKGTCSASWARTCAGGQSLSSSRECGCVCNYMLPPRQLDLCRLKWLFEAILCDK